jgi:serine/threonine-protein kinase
VGPQAATVDPPATDAGAPPAEHATVDLGGHCFGGSYVLLDVVGQGATGTVWRAVDRASGEHVAVKLLREELMHQPRAVARFVQERAILLRLRHRHIVGVRDMLTVSRSLGLVMDLVDGGNLRDHLAGRGTLPPAEAARLLGQVAEALAEAHRSGVVHRDLKPDNVLLDGAVVPDARLTDFGIARVLEAPGLTAMHVLVGTPDYMAPEVIQGLSATPAADVYGLGVLLYELVVGRPPYRGGPSMAVLRRHLDLLPVRPPGMPDTVWSVIDACMQKQPTRRPDAATLVRTLRRAAADTVGAPALPPPPPDAATAAPDPAAGRQPSVRTPRARRFGHGRRARRFRHGRRDRVGAGRWARLGAVAALTLAVVLSASAPDALRALGDPAGRPHGHPGPPASTPTAPTPRPAPPSAAGGGTGTAQPAVPTPGGPSPGAPSSPALVQAEIVPYGPWRCAEAATWDVGHPLLSRPCYAVGPGIRVMGRVQALPTVQADVALALEDAATGRTVAGPYTCKGIVFTEVEQEHSCGPFDTATVPHGHRYVVVASWTYSGRGLLPAGSARGPEFEW